MIILGINGNRREHNSAAAILVDGKLVASVEEERISRIKGDNAYPVGAIAEVMAIAGLGEQDIDMVAQVNLSRREQKPYLDRLFERVAELGKQDPELRKFYWKHQFERYARVWRPRRKPAGALADRPMQAVEHHQAHAASAYYACPFGDERIGVITLDGAGDFSWGSVWIGESGKMREIAHLPYLNSIGLLYSAITHHLGFIAGRHEGKVLGLAAFGNPEPFLSRLLAHTNPADWNMLFDAKLARIALRPVSPMGCSVVKELCGELSREDIAAGLQAYTEKIICGWVQEQVSKLNVSKLALAGGVFSNVKLNQRILALPGIENIYVHPNMGDGGLATGAAFEVYARLYGGLNRRIWRKPLDGCWPMARWWRGRTEGWNTVRVRWATAPSWRHATTRASTNGSTGNSRALNSCLLRRLSCTNMPRNIFPPGTKRMWPHAS